MTPPALHVGARMARVEDRPLLTGGARFCDDIELPGLAHAAVIRSPEAHGVLRAVHADLTVPVDLVLGPDDVADAGPIPVVWHQPHQWQTERQLADGRVRFVGQALGVVVAASRYLAEDALDEIVVDIDPLPAVTDLDAALRDDTLLYPDAGTNVYNHWTTGDAPEHTDAVFAAADHVVRFPMSCGRVIGAPMECRGIVVDPGDPRDPRAKLTIWTSTQAPHSVRDVVADVTGLPQHRIRVIAPDVGGGFGIKDHVYDDELLVVLAALRLGRPIKWIEDRWESLTASSQARDERYDVEVAFDDDGRLRGLRIDAVRNCGAFLDPFAAGPLFTFTGTVPGPYTWDAVSCSARGVATTTTPTAAYRGFGQTQCTFVRERAVDLVAHHLGMDPAELRARNLIRPEQQPYAIRTVPTTYDNGDYPESLQRARAMVEAWPEPPEDGRRRGTGYAMYVQMAGVGPSRGNPFIGLGVGSWESTTLRMERDGTVRAYVGVSPHGQGHATTFSQLIADHLGVDPSQVELIVSDTDVTPYSAFGTAASRSIAVGGGATVKAADRLAARLRDLAGELLEAASDDIVLADGRATVIGTQIGLSLGEVADRAWQGWGLPAGHEPGLVEHATYDPEEFTYSYSTHACRVAIDPETGLVEVERYAVVLDCGTVVNPTIVEGQVHGGVAQGLGPALLEQAVVDDDGQPRTTTFLDYLLPTAADVPDIEVELTEHPSASTPGGMKGMGEGGTNGGFACVVNAVGAALGDATTEVLHPPLTPSAVWSWCRAADEHGT